MHRDIKPENILISSNGQIKLCDFGFSAFLSKDVPRLTLCGTQEYLAPEVLSNKNQTEKVDIWCLGILLYEMLHKHTPFRSRNFFDMLNEITRSTVVYKENINP